MFSGIVSSLTPPVTISTQYVVVLSTVCGGPGGEGGSWVVLETIYCRFFTLCIGPDSDSTKLLDHPKTKTKTLERMGHQTNKHETIAKKLLRRRDFALPSIRLISTMEWERKTCKSKKKIRKGGMMKMNEKEKERIKERSSVQETRGIGVLYS